MRFPSPADLARAPIWDNYVIAQTVQASLGLIPSDALAVGVEVAGNRVRVVFQLSALSPQGLVDMDDIVDELRALMGDDVDVARAHVLLDHPVISPHDGVSWIFLARVGQ